MLPLSHIASGSDFWKDAGLCIFKCPAIVSGPTELGDFVSLPIPWENFPRRSHSQVTFASRSEWLHISETSHSLKWIFHCEGFTKCCKSAEAPGRVTSANFCGPSPGHSEVQDPRFLKPQISRAFGAAQQSRAIRDPLARVALLFEDAGYVTPPPSSLLFKERSLAP